MPANKVISVASAYLWPKVYLNRKFNYHNTAVIYTALQAIHNGDRLGQLDNDSNSRQVYLSSSLPRMALVNNDLQPPSFIEEKKTTFELIVVRYSRCQSVSQLVWC